MKMTEAQTVHLSQNESCAIFGILKKKRKKRMKSCALCAEGEKDE